MPRYIPPFYWSEIRLLGKTLDWWRRMFLLVCSVIATVLGVLCASDWLFPKEGEASSLSQRP